MEVMSWIYKYCLYGTAYGNCMYYLVVGTKDKLRMDQRLLEYKRKQPTLVVEKTYQGTCDFGYFKCRTRRIKNGEEINGDTIIKYWLN